MFDFQVLDQRITLSALANHVRWNREAELLGGFQFNRELKFCRLLDWKISVSQSSTLKFSAF
jgi:hypothetical protein